ncbi:MAG: hypothetical protein AAGD07_03965 [Planctomycetota bacterium]
MNRIIRIAFLCACPISFASQANATVLTLGASGSADFGSHVTWATTGNTVSMTGLIDDSPLQGDFRFETSLSASALGTPSNGGGSAFFLTTVLDPSSLGAISSIDYLIEQDRSGSAAKIQLMIRQNGNFYRSMNARDVVDDGVFTDFSQLGLTANSFGRWDNATATTTTDRPDFSVAGGLIEIGLASDFGTGGISQTRDQEIQDFSVTITTVPEPSGLAFVCVGVLLCLLGRRQDGRR